MCARQRQLQIFSSWPPACGVGELDPASRYPNQHLVGEAAQSVVRAAASWPTVCPPHYGGSAARWCIAQHCLKIAHRDECGAARYSNTLQHRCPLEGGCSEDNNRVPWPTRHGVWLLHYVPWPNRNPLGFGNKLRQLQTCLELRAPRSPSGGAGEVGCPVWTLQSQLTHKVHLREVCP